MSAEETRIKRVLAATTICLELSVAYPPHREVLLTIEESSISHYLLDRTHSHTHRTTH